MKNIYFKNFVLIIASLAFLGAQAQSGAWTKKADLPKGFLSTTTDVAAGAVSGTWTLENSPYHILGEITIPDGQTLTIEPGVEVVFMGHYKLNVQGRLLAVGTLRDTISFSAEDKDAGWHGLRFIDTPATNDISRIVYCSLKYGKANTGSGLDRSGGAIMISGYSKVLISDCLFEYNMTSGDIGSTGGPGVCIFNGSPTVTRNTFIHNDGTLGSAGAIKVDFASEAIISNNIISYNSSYCGAIICAYSSANRPTISGNVISYNSATAGGGILVYSSSNARIENNLIIHNQAQNGGGIYCLTNANPVLINNTIAYNNAATSGGGISCDENSDPVVINTILHDNSAGSGSQVFIADAASTPDFLYCNIQDGKEGFGGGGAGANYTGQYENNIHSDPVFMHAASENYRLSSSSPCIGHGVDSMQIEGDWIHAPQFCIMGMARPSPAGTTPDIGACENVLGSPTAVEQEISYPTEFALYQNYPNPFNPSTKIQFSIPEQSYITVKVFDVLGREVAVLVQREMNAGRYEAEFDGTDLTGGIYFYTMQARNFADTKKFILLR